MMTQTAWGMICGGWVLLSAAIWIAAALPRRGDPVAPDARREAREGRVTRYLGWWCAGLVVILAGSYLDGALVL